MCVRARARPRDIATEGNSLVNSRRETMQGREATARPHAVIPSHCFPSTTPTAAADGNLVFFHRALAPCALACSVCSLSSSFLFVLALLFFQIPHPSRFLRSIRQFRGSTRKQPPGLKARRCRLSKGRREMYKRVRERLPMHFDVFKPRIAGDTCFRRNAPPS